MTVKQEPVTVLFECGECDHEWVGVKAIIGHVWEICPNCGADDGENCWDCGLNVIEEDSGGLRCNSCQHTLCWDCTGGVRSSFYSPHKSGRDEDQGECGATRRVL
jgi:hypothetical protein